MLDDFEGFWSAYPRKVGKGQARKAYAKAVKLAPHDEIMFGLSQQRPCMEAKEPQFIPHASTWLNGERWEDEPELNTPAPNVPRGGGNGGGMAGNTTAESIAARALEYATSRNSGR